MVNKNFNNNSAEPFRKEIEEKYVNRPEEWLEANIDDRVIDNWKLSNEGLVVTSAFVESMDSTGIDEKDAVLSHLRVFFK